MSECVIAAYYHYSESQPGDTMECSQNRYTNKDIIRYRESFMEIMDEIKDWPFTVCNVTTITHPYIDIF